MYCDWCDNSYIQREPHRKNTAGQCLFFLPTHGAERQLLEVMQVSSSCSMSESHPFPPHNFNHRRGSRYTIFDRDERVRSPNPTLMKQNTGAVNHLIVHILKREETNKKKKREKSQNVEEGLFAAIWAVRIVCSAKRPGGKKRSYFYAMNHRESCCCS